MKCCTAQDVAAVAAVGDAATAGGGGSDFGDSEGASDEKSDLREHFENNE